MNEKLPLYKLVISDNAEGEEEVDFIALVEYPAIQRNFLAFNQQFVEPSQGEKQDDFLQRCISYVVDEGKDTEQAVAICNSLWEQHFAGDKVSFDYDDTLSTARGKELATKEISNGNIVYIISARQDKEAMLDTAKELGIPESRVYATGSNKAKVEKVKELGITKHYDNNADVISELGSIGQKFAENSFNDYPEGVKNNAKNVLKYAEENGWGSCGTPVGKQRANQLANGEAISLDTIKRMYSYLSRHEVDLESSKSYSDGCGKLMYDAWGGKAALGWSRNKLRELGELEMNLQFAIQNEEQRIVSGPLMIADLPIYRRDEQGEYYVVFSAPEIKKIVQRFFEKGYQSNVNIEHDQKVKDVFMFESYIIDREKGVNPPKGFEDLTDGSWWGSFKVNNDAIWEQCKDGTFNGFSIEGLFKYERASQDIVSKEEETMAAIIEILKQIEQ